MRTARSAKTATSNASKAETFKAAAGKAAGAAGAIAIGAAVSHQIDGSTGVRVFALVVEAFVLIAIRAGLQPRSLTPARTMRPDPNAGFPSYRHFVTQLRPASASRADFERSMRPVLLRLFGQTLAVRYGVTVSGDRERARALMGDAAWLLDDPVNDVTSGDDERRVDAREIERLTARLEELSA